MIITIDGTAGTGKTTVAKLLAAKLGFSYFDTGAMYRAATWLCLHKQIDPQDSVAVEKIFQDFDFHIFDLSGQRRYFLGAHDVTEAIRSPEVTAHVSQISAYPFVRHALQKIQKNFAKKSIHSVFEGRDMGSAVFPEAEVKIFLTARPEIRAMRRLQQWEGMCNNKEALNQIQSDLERRDAFDSSRELNPLVCPEGAFVFDTSDYTVEEVIEHLLHYVRARL